MKKGCLNRNVMLHEAWIEDGHVIGKLKAAEAFLARRLAELGVSPDEDVDAEPLDPGEVDELARAWVQAADVDAALSFEQGLN